MPIKTILFDLDGTLLNNGPMDVFIDHYFRLLCARFKDQIPPDLLVKTLWRSVEKMVKHDPAITNEESFSAFFYPELGRTRADMEPVLNDFYREDFPRLQQYAPAFPDARRAVQAAFDRGYRVAIATNPIFPATAIHQRVDWAGVSGFPYLKITTYENSHAAKPNPAYYQELLKEFDCLPEETLMVGDEDMDMIAAHLGCQTYWIAGSPGELAPTTPPPTYSGTLTDLISLLS